MKLLQQLLSFDWTVTFWGAELGEHSHLSHHRRVNKRSSLDFMFSNSNILYELFQFLVHLEEDDDDLITMTTESWSQVIGSPFDS